VAAAAVVHQRQQAAALGAAVEAMRQTILVDLELLIKDMLVAMALPIVQHTQMAAAAAALAMQVPLVHQLSAVMAAMVFLPA
jgi:hypothetical protein